MIDVLLDVTRERRSVLVDDPVLAGALAHADVLAAALDGNLATTTV